MKTYSLLIAAFTLLLFTNLNAASSQTPNVILIFADDLGPGMLSCNGQEIVPTPHIDRLADEGISFQNYYGGVYCAPARWTLLTGMHDGRLGGHSNNRSGLLIRRDSGEITEEEFQVQFAELKANSHPIPDHEVFLAEVAQQAGYKTAQFGKLDRGFLTWHERVKRFGWDFYEGMYSHVRCHGFYPPYIWRNGEKVELEGNPYPNCGKASPEGMEEPVGWGGKTYSQDVFMDGILKYIREHAASVRSGEPTKPFFLYHPTQLPHGPNAVPAIHPDYVNDSRLDLSQKKYATMVKMLDDDVGEIIAELKKQGLDENTVVFFASDNGHEMYSGPFMNYKKQKDLETGEKLDLLDNKFRSSKYDVFKGAGDRAGLKRSGYQGGMQCPMIVRWPGQIEPGRSTNLLSAHYDFMATLADLTGGTLPKGKDSVSYLPTLLGEPQTETHDYVVVHNKMKIMGGSALIARDGWKLIEDNKTGEFQLYNILKDNAERNELSKQHPERVASMKKILLSQKDSERPDL